MSDRNNLTFTVGKKYKNRIGEIVELVYKDLYHLEFGKSNYTTHINGLRNGSPDWPSTLDIMSEYIEPVPFDWTKPAQTKLGVKVKALHNFGSLADKYPLAGILQGGAASNSWTLEGKSYSSKDYDLVNVPEPKKVVPLEPSDIKPGQMFRCKDWIKQGWLLVTGLTFVYNKWHVRLEDHIIPLDLLEYRWEVSRDGGKTWEGCSKEV